MDQSSSPPTAGPSGHREDLLQNAVLFLRDPKVVNSSFTSKVQFLESKGLNEGEIQEALRRASSSSPSAGSSGTSGAALQGRGGDYGYSYAVAQRPPPPRRDWRDLFIMAVVSGGVVYGLTTLAKKYLMPHLQPPSSTAFQTTSSELGAQYDEAARLLSELQSSTSALQETLNKDRERLEAAVEEVEEVTRSVRDGEEKWREEMREIRGEVESVRELVPRLIEKHASSQSTSLAELQSELRSLKTLLSSRQASIAAPGAAPSANGPESETYKAANALLGKGKAVGRGIPAWQLPSSSSGSTPAGSAKESEKGSREGSDSEAAGAR